MSIMRESKAPGGQTSTSLAITYQNRLVNLVSVISLFCRKNVSNKPTFDLMITRFVCFNNFSGINQISKAIKVSCVIR